MAATTVALCDPNNSMGVFTSVPPLSTVTITESDTGGMVFEGDVATFHVHAEWTWAAGRPTVFYSTMDPSGAAPTDYVSSRGPQAVAFGAATYDSDTGTWSADATIQVNTIGGIDGGGDGSVKVQLTHLFMGQFAGDGTATETIQEPWLKIYLTDAEFTTPVDVTDNEPVDVKVGEYVTLTAELNGQGPAATWVLPGNGEVIKSYVETLPKNQLTQLGVAGVGVNAGSSRGFR